MTEVTSVRVRMKHIRAERLCAGGAREWWRRHKLDWSDFLANGIEASVLEATGDAYALRVVERARAEAEEDGRRG